MILLAIVQPVIHIWLAYFPPGTIHLAVVDPGVGTDRKIIAGRYNDQTVVAPDNGLVSFVDAEYPLESIASVRNRGLFLRSPVGTTFDGRDVMAPVAAALVDGAKLQQLGPPPDTYKLLDLPEVQYGGGVLVGRVLYIDRFGNCITNIRRELITQSLPALGRVEVSAGGQMIGRLLGAFAHAQEGQPLALLNSMDLVEIAVNAGNAREVLNLSVGDEVVVSYGQ